MLFNFFQGYKFLKVNPKKGKINRSPCNRCGNLNCYAYYKLDKMFKGENDIIF